MGAVGCNVTMPGKVTAAWMADETTKVVKLSGAANTLVFDEGKIFADSTDGKGFINAVKNKGLDLFGKTITVLGSGGAAGAICAQCALDGVRAINIFRRKNSHFEKAVSFGKRLEEATDCEVYVHDLGDKDALKEWIFKSACLLNATNVGMNPSPNECPIPDQSFLKRKLVVCDLVYDPVETMLLKMAKDVGCETVTGKSVLLYQGAASFERFTGKQMPVEEVKKNVFNSKI